MARLAAIVAVSKLGFSLGEGQCSSTLGSCHAPKASLMQVKSVGGQKKLSLQETGAATSMSETLAGFQKYADGLVKEYLEGSLVLSPEVDQAIDTIIKYIDEMYGHLWEAHGMDVTEAGTYGNRVQSCYQDTWLEENHAEKLGTLKSLINEYARSHIECRQGLSEFCVGTMTGMFDCADWESGASGGSHPPHCKNVRVSPPSHCAIGDDHCAIYDTYRQQNEDALLPQCAQTVEEVVDDKKVLFPGDLRDEYIQADEVAQSTELERMEGCLDAMKDWLDPLYEKYECCDRGEECPYCRDEAARCQKKQEDFEFEQCLYDTEVGILCGGYDACFEKVVSDSKADCDAIQIRANARAADNETGERIKCLLGVLKIDDNATEVAAAGTQSKADKLKECQSSANDDKYSAMASIWDVPCPTGVPPNWESGKQYPEGIDCQAYRPDTCSDDFFAMHYQQDADGASTGLQPHMCQNCGTEGSTVHCEGEQLRHSVGACRQCSGTSQLHESKAFAGELSPKGM